MGDDKWDVKDLEAKMVWRLMMSDSGSFFDWSSKIAKAVRGLDPLAARLRPNLELA